MATTNLSEFALAVNSNIKAELARRDLKPPAIAQAVGMKVDALRRRIRGELPWGLDEIARLAILLGVKPSDLTRE